MDYRLKHPLSHDPNDLLGGASPCPVGTPFIRPDKHTVQNVLGIIEGALRRTGRVDQSCHEYPKLCATNAVGALQSGELEGAHPAIQDALHGVLASVEKGPSFDEEEDGPRSRG